MIKLNIDVTKIPKDRIRSNPNWKGKFIDLILVDKPSEKSDGFITMDMSKEERDQGLRGVIIGEWKKIESNRPRPTTVVAANNDEEAW